MSIRPRGQDKEEDFPCKAPGRDRMHRCGQHVLDQAADGVNLFAVVMWYIGDRGREWSRGVLLTNRVEVNVRCFP